MTQAIFCCYPWDLVDEGCEAAVGRLAGEIGVDAISVAAATTGVAELRGRSCDGPRIFRTPSAVHFQPTAKYYGAAGIRPPAASWMKTRDPLERIIKAAERERLAVRASIACCESETLVARNPHAACVGIFGDVSPRRLCPNNPGVRAYLGALIENLATEHALQAIELSHFDFDGLAAISDIERGAAASEAEQALLSWCFCSSCRQRAGENGIDANAAMAAGRARLDEMFARTAVRECSTGAMIQSEPLLAGYEAMRKRSVVSLVQDLRGRTRLPLHLHIGGISDAVQIKALNAECDGVVCSGSALETLPLLGISADRLGVRLRCYGPEVTDGPSLVARVHDLWRRGCAQIGFDHYGLAPAPCLEWVRQALRYARRDTSGAS